MLEHSCIKNVRKNVTMLDDTYISPTGKQKQLRSEWEGSNYSFKLIAFLIGLGLLPCVIVVGWFFTLVF